MSESISPTSIRQIRITMCLVLWASVIHLLVSPGAGGAEAGALVFKLEPFNITEYDGPLKYHLRMGQPVVFENQGPSSEVKAYPPLKSALPVYGQIFLGGNPFDPSSGEAFHFVLDESGGPGSGYDRLVFDQNRDLDLTNDPVIRKDANPPQRLVISGLAGAQVVFEAFDVVLNSDNAAQARTQRVIPEYQGVQERHVVSFLAPVGRAGKIQLGSQTHDCILAQSVITGGFDSPWLYCFLDGKAQGLDVLGCRP